MLCGIVVILSACDFMSTPTTGDLAEAKRIYHALMQRIREQAPPRISSNAIVYSRTGIRNTTLIVYNIVDHQEQDWMLGSLKSLRSQVATKPMLVNFYEKEVWFEQGASKTRGKEKLLRRETIP
jgi:hypothetical protein